MSDSVGGDCDPEKPLAIARDGSETPCPCAAKLMPDGVRFLAPYFHRHNGPNARAARATERMRQVSKALGSEKGEQNCARDGSDRHHIDQVVRGQRQCR